jgi:type V secretory pathway adhesin AidA
VLGFDSNTSYTSTLNTLTSEYPVDLSGNNIVYVSISNLRTNNTDAGTSNSVSSIISSILINVPYGYLQYYDSSDNTGLILLEDHISFLHVSILGEDAMTLLDFHNQNWAMTLIIQFIPKNEYHTPPNNLNMSDLYKNYLKTLKIN